MKKNLNVIFLILLVVFVSNISYSLNPPISFASYKVTNTTMYYTVPQEDEVSKYTPYYANQFNLFLDKDYIGFKEALGFKESRGYYNTINEFGYLGKYQFGKSTLKMIGIYNVQSFLKDTKLQEAAFKANASRNKWILRKDIKRYAGRRINGVVVTESGILAAAHLAGPGNVKKYLRSQGVHQFSDAYGTTIANYLKKFSGYDTSFVIPNKKAKVLL